MAFGTFTLTIGGEPTAVTATRTGVAAPNVVTANDTSNRGGYLHVGKNDSGTAGIRISVSNVAVT